MKNLIALTFASLIFIQSPLLGVEPSPPPTPTLTVKGTATLSKKADLLHLSLGVVTQSQTAEKALSENSSNMHSILQALKETGLKDEEFETGRFTIRPLFSQPPKNASQDWTPEVVGYQVTNTLNISSDKIDSAGKLIDAATQAGANSIENIYFSLKDSRQYRKEAIQLATKNAMDDANALKDAAQVSLTRILSLSLDDAYTPIPVPRSGFMAKSYAQSVPIEAGEVTIHASVHIQYEIKN